MEPIIKETFVSFKVLEQKMFDFVCELAREATKTILESYDKELAEERDKAEYRNKGSRSTNKKSIRQIAKETGCSVGHVQDVIKGRKR